jgi:hypothetical protein
VGRDVIPPNIQQIAGQHPICCCFVAEISSICVGRDVILPNIQQTASQNPACFVLWVKSCLLLIAE